MVKYPPTDANRVLQAPRTDVVLICNAQDVSKAPPEVDKVLQVLCSVVESQLVRIGDSHAHEATLHQRHVIL